MDDGARQAVDRLLALVPPPARPFRSGDWSQVEAELGVSLPPDFVELANIWGEGALADHVNISAPDRFVERSERMLQWEREAREASDDPGPRLWPVLCGLLPWADTGNGDQLWWKTGGSSDRWTVSTQEARSDDIVETLWTTSEALLAFVEGRTELFGGFDDGLEPWFAPAREASVHLEWGDVHAARKGDADDLVFAAAEILPVASPRGGWADGANFQRHWVTGDDEWSVTLERHGDLVGLRLTCSATQEDAARRAAAAVAERLGVTWAERGASRYTRDQT